MENKKVYLIGSAIILAGLLLLGISQVIAQDYDPYGTEIEDSCGFDNAVCSGESPAVTVSWTAAPQIKLSGFGFGKATYYDPGNYVLTIAGVGSYTTAGTSYTISSGLSNNTTYNWSVDAFYEGGTSAAAMGLNQPSGSFTTPDCAIPECSDTSWSPDASEVCSSSGSFTQTSNCGNIRTVAAGTKTCTAPQAHISLSPSSLSFSGISGGSTPASQSLIISNTGNAVLNWSGSTNQGWCHLGSTSGSINAGASQSVSVSVDSPSNIGSFSCAITISAPGADDSPQMAEAIYTVSSSGQQNSCSRCSTTYKYAWATFATDSLTCDASSVPIGTPSYAKSCACTAGTTTYNPAWDAECSAVTVTSDCPSGNCGGGPGLSTPVANPPGDCGYAACPPIPLELQTPSCSLTAKPANLLPPQSITTLSWTCQRASSCYLGVSSLPVGYSTPAGFCAALSGTMEGNYCKVNNQQYTKDLSLKKTIDFTLNCGNANGSVITTSTAKVSEPTLIEINPQ